MTHRVTLDDIAVAANVSKATVSKALNDTGQLAAHTRRLVLKTAEDLGYRKPISASAMQRKTGLIGLVSADLEGRFSTPALMSTENTLGTTNHAVLLTNSRGDPKLERAHIDQLAARGIDGLLVLGGETDLRPPIKPNTALAFPSSTPMPINRPQRLLGDLRQRQRWGDGHQPSAQPWTPASVVIISGPEHYQATKDRLAGARRAAEQAGIRLAAPVRYGSWREAWGRTATRLLLEDDVHVDGIYCLNDMLARGAIETLHDWDLRVPEDVEVIGHDNWAVTATECRVPITSFDNNLQEIGRRAARQLLDAIKGNPHHGTTYIGCSLVTRKSTSA